MTRKLLGRAVALIKAIDEVNTCTADLKNLRESIENEFATIYKQAERIKFRFIRFSTRAATILCLFPSIICSTEEDLYLNNIITEHRDDLPNWECADQEI